MKFVKCSWEKNQKEFWYGYDERTPLSNATIFRSNGQTKNNVDITFCEILTLDNWEQLDYHGTVVNDDCYKTGWVTPQGKFYGCEYNFHNMQARLLHKHYEDELEKLGFIKITHEINNTGKKELLVLCYAKPTIHQIKWFKQNYTEPNREEVLSLLDICTIYYKNDTNNKEKNFDM